MLEIDVVADVVHCASWRCKEEWHKASPSEVPFGDKHGWSRIVVPEGIDYSPKYLDFCPTHVERGWGFQDGMRWASEKAA